MLSTLSAVLSAVDWVEVGVGLAKIVGALIKAAI